jgi:chaperonin GroEL
LATLVVNKLRGIFNVLAVKAPGFGDRRKEMLQDIAVVTGAQFVSEDVGKKLENVDISDLGRAHRVVSNKDATTIVGGKGDKKAIEERVAQLKAQVKKTDSEFDREKLQERLGKLMGGVAVVKVGAPTESAQKELKQRVEDAVAATRAAMEEGIVPGGGIALFNVLPVAEEMAGVKAGVSDDEKLAATVRYGAAEILLRALRAPLAAIIANSGESASKIEDIRRKKVESSDVWLGFNAVTNKIANLKEAGIIDPLKVVKTAFVNAVSVAANYITVGVAMTAIPEKKDKAVPPGMGGGEMDY